MFIDVIKAANIAHLKIFLIKYLKERLNYAGPHREDYEKHMN
jgi:hypothetical protein